MSLFLIAAICLFIYMNIAFVISLITKNNSYMDVFYGGGFVLIALISYPYSWYHPLSFILLLLVLLWGIRLIVRIYLRNKGKPEDYRYKKMRDDWGPEYIKKSYLKIYMTQGFGIYFIALPIMLLGSFYSSSYIFLLVALGLIGWVVGFLFEAIADLQLEKFIKDPNNKGKLLTTGLWKYSRHPNYFGESLIWVSIAVFVFGGIYNSLGIFSLIVLVSPALITFTLLKYSGIPMLERKSKEKPGWDEYRRKTSPFVPLPPRKLD